jgi:hypothetical protein
VQDEVEATPPSLRKEIKVEGVYVAVQNRTPPPHCSKKHSQKAAPTCSIMQQRYSIVFDGLRRRRRCEEVRDPKIEHPRDASMKLNACTICGTVARMVSR